MDEFETNTSGTEQMSAFIRGSYALRMIGFMTLRTSTPLVALVLMLGALVIGGESARAQSVLASQEEKAQAAQKAFASPSSQDEVRSAGDTRVSLHFDDVLVEEAVQRIAEVAGLTPSYGSSIVATKEKVTLDLDRVTVSEALQAVTQNVGLEAVILHDNRLVLFEANKVEPMDQRAFHSEMRQGTVTGTVTDSLSGEPIPGVNVVIAGTQQGSATDVEGRYTISGVEAGTHALQASFVGYSAKTIEGVEVQEGQTTQVDFQLAESAIALEEVVAIGYGEQRRRDVTGSLTSISGAAIEQAAATSLDQGLQGQAAGVFVTNTSSQPGGGTTVRIRGASSINAGNEPLYVIDGVPVYNSISRSRTGVNVGSGVNPLATIGADDIESIEVLKDASATAIYGSRGSNGVVLITTKKGNVGQDRVSFDASYSSERVARKMDLLNARQFAELANEAHRNAGNPLPFTDEEIAQLGEGTDWQDEIFRAAPTQNYNLSFSGGDELTQYLVSGNYLDQEGVVKGSDFNRVRVRANIQREVSSDFRTGANLSVSRSNSNIISSDFTYGAVYQALLMPPVYPVKGEDGSWTRENTFGIGVGNPVAQVSELDNKSNVTRYLGNAFLEYDVSENITARTSLGLDFFDNEQSYFAPNNIYEGAASGGQARVGEVSRKSWVSETTINYRDEYAEKHQLDILGGFTVEDNYRTAVTAGSSDFVSNLLSYNDLSAGATVSTPSSSWTRWNLMSWLGRANYIFDNRYLLTLTGRVDGSSRFGSGNKLGFFPSLALAWTVTEEEFMSGSDFFDELKLRTSLGETGNQEIGNFNHLNVLSSGAVILGNQRQISFAPNAVGNPDLRWERTQQFNAGLDASVLGSKVQLTVDYYYKLTRDMIFYVPMPKSSGFNTSIQNAGSMRNRGVDVDLSLNESVGDASFGISFNMNVNRNEILDLGERGEFFAGGSDGNLKIDNTFVVREGVGIGAFYGFVFDGVFQDVDEVESSSQPNANPGDVRYKDVNGDGVINQDDRTIIGDAQPDFSGGVSANFAFRNLELNATGVFVYGNDIFNMNRVELDMPSGAGNASTRVLERWTSDRPSNTIQEATRVREAPFSDRLLEDGSYFRVQNVTIAYNLPTSFVDGAGVTNARLFVSGDNLAVFTGYTGFDPDVSSYGQNVMAMGHDRGSYPATRSITVGVNLGF